MKKYLIIITCLILIPIGLYYLAKNNTEATKYNTSTENFINETPQKVLDLIQNREKGIYYFGFETCPWCIEILPVLEDVLEENKIQSYAVDTKSEEFANLNIEKLTKDYQNTTKNTDTLKVPFILVIYESGEIAGHMGTVESHDASKEKMTVKQKQELTKILEQMINLDSVEKDKIN